MRTLIIAALVALPTLSGAATADELHMTRSEFNRAARCLAYVNLAPLQADRPDTTALNERFAAEIAERPVNTKNEVKADTRDIRVAANNADTSAKIERLKMDRNRACAMFLDAAVTAQN